MKIDFDEANDGVIEKTFKIEKGVIDRVNQLMCATCSEDILDMGEPLEECVVEYQFRINDDVSFELSVHTGVDSAWCIGSLWNNEGDPIDEDEEHDKIDSTYYFYYDGVTYHITIQAN